MKQFSGKTVMVTGAGRNIGKDIAIAFAKKGANVVVCDLSEENACATAAEIRALGVGAMAAACDVRDRKRYLPL